MCFPLGEYETAEDAAATIADHAFFQYERMLQRESGPELTITLPPQPEALPSTAHGQADGQAAGNASSQRHVAVANGTGDGTAQPVLQSGSMPEHEPLSNGNVRGSVRAEGDGAVDSGRELVAASGNQQAAASGNMHQNGQPTTGGAAPMDVDSAALANGSTQTQPQLRQAAHAEGKPAPTNLNGKGGKNGDAKVDTVAAAEGMRTLLIRIEYEVDKPQCGTLFWGPFAHTNNQVQAHMHQHPAWRALTPIAKNCNHL